MMWVMRPVLSVLLLLLREVLLRLLIGLSWGRLVRGLRYRLGYRLRGSLGDIGLLICPCLRLVRAILGLRRRRGLHDRGRRLVCLLGLLLLLPLLLLPVRPIPIVCV